MSIYFIKPVVWNNEGYQHPAGGKFVSGYPKDNGFGHEEWNNSAKLDLKDRGEDKHAFHTEGLGNQKLDRFAGNIFIFMVASYEGTQFLVSIAGKSTALFGDQNRSERIRLLAQLNDEQSFFDEAWRVKSVQAAFDGNRNKFTRRWKDERHWFVTWTCPTELYLGLARPIALDPLSITGRKRLVGMYGSYQEIDRTIALRMLDQISSDEDQGIVSNLKAACSSDRVDVSDDIDEIESRPSIRPTTRRALIDARLGQGKFRAQLDDRWDRSCAVTGCNVSAILRASHIKPWRASNDSERLDPANGLLLAAHLDALFDAGLITFSNKGSIVASNLFADNGNPKLGLGGKLRTPPSASMIAYLEYHRNRVFRTNPQFTRRQPRA